MDDDEDAWSYSFPPSTELLPMRVKSDSTLPQHTHNDPNMIVMPADSDDSDYSLSGTNGSDGEEAAKSEEAKYGITPSFLNSHQLDRSSVTAPLADATDLSPTSNILMAPVAVSPARNGQDAVFGPPSGLLQPAFMLKAVPANPHTTKEEANSIILKEAQTNALAATTAASADTGAISPPLTPTAKQGFRDSVRIWQQQQQQSAELEDRADESIERASEESSFFRKTLDSFASSPMFKTLSNPQVDPRADAVADNVASPKIIAYRKTSHQRTESENYDNGLRQERFDPKLYVDEKYANTIYRYATMKRNVDFHQLFRSIDLTDRLLDDFACALSREILLQGRIYVTEHSVCFNLNLLGWVTSLVVPFSDIVRIDKKSTAGLFPNGILIETTDAKHNFASFLSRDSTYDFIRTIWLTSTGKNLEDLDQLGLEVSSRSSDEQKLSNARKISNFILSIDDDEQNQLLWDQNGVDYDVEDESDDDEEDYSEEGDSEDDNISDSNLEPQSAEKITKTSALKEEKLFAANGLLTSTTQLRKLNEDSKYKNLGPDVHPPTELSQQFSDSESEVEVCNESFSAPMGVVFDILFGTNDTSFQRRFLESHDASEIDHYDAFHPVEDEPTKLERTYTYRRALGYSIGPKSTKCEVSEVVEHLNFADYIVVLNTTATPDVPSGGSFSVNTRYYFTWGKANTTQLRIAYFVKWTGRSWIKNVVEKLTLSAQIAVTKDLIKQLNEEIAKHTTAVAGPADVTQKEPETRSVKTVKTKKKKKVPKKKAAQRPKGTGWLLLSGIYLVVLLLMAIVYVQVMVVRSLGETRDLVSRQLVITTGLIGLLSSENNGWWNKLKSPQGDTKQELASYYAQQALLVLMDESGDPRLREAAANFL